jgi:hypothetical protein
VAGRSGAALLAQVEVEAGAGGEVAVGEDVGEVEAGVGEDAVEGGALVGGGVGQAGAELGQAGLVFARSRLDRVAVGAFSEEFLREGEGLVAEAVGLDREGLVFAHDSSSSFSDILRPRSAHFLQCRTEA